MSSESRIAELRDLGCDITDAAVATAFSITGQLPHLHVGIFPSGDEDGDDGGINLQAVTDTSTIIVFISADGTPVAGKCADDAAFHEQELWDRSEAIRWFQQFAPESA